MRIGMVFKNKKKLAIMAAIIGLSLIAASVPSFPGFAPTSAQAATVTTVTLAKSTLYHDTPMYIIKSGQPGPVVMIVGGSHGDCTSGILAADKIRNFKITTGTLLVIPRANIVACNNGTRTSSGAGDLNRDYPTTKDGKAASITAQSIWDAVKDYDVDYLIDMCEGDNYHKIDPSSTGQTLIYYPISGSQAVGQKMIDAINKTIGSSSKHFSLVKNPYPSTLARAAAQFLGVKAFTLETCRRSAESIRVDDEVLAAKTLLSYLGMMGTYTAITTPNTVTASEKPYVDAFRASFNGSLAQTLVGRAIWYMEYGYMVYGHTSYAKTGYIDCSQFVSRVYGDFGYSINSASRNYTTVGTRVSGVYGQKISGTSRYQLVGVDNLKPGDIFTFWAKDSAGNKYISHVALYIGKVNGKPAIINTCGDRPTAIGIVTSFSYWYGSNLYDVRRVLPSQAQVKGGVAINDKGPVIPAVYQMKKGPVILPRDLPQGF